MTLTQIMNQHPAQTTFSGLGPYDVFAAPGRRYVGTVIFSMAAPPFIKGNSKDYYFAPEHRFFARGLIEIVNGRAYFAPAEDYDFSDSVP